MEVVLVAEPVTPALDDANPVVEPFDEPSATLFSGMQ